MENSYLFIYIVLIAPFSSDKYQCESYSWTILVRFGPPAKHILYNGVRKLL